MKINKLKDNNFCIELTYDQLVDLQCVLHSYIVDFDEDDCQSQDLKDNFNTACTLMSKIRDGVK